MCGWVVDMIWQEVYVVKAISEDECVCISGFDVFKCE